jgi:hypothetical protein
MGRLNAWILAAGSAWSFDERHRVVVLLEIVEDIVDGRALLVGSKKSMIAFVMLVVVWVVLHHCRLASNVVATGLLAHCYADVAFGHLAGIEVDVLVEAVNGVLLVLAVFEELQRILEEALVLVGHQLTTQTTLAAEELLTWAAVACVASLCILADRVGRAKVRIALAAPIVVLLRLIVALIVLLRRSVLPGRTSVRVVVEGFTFCYFRRGFDFGVVDRQGSLG